MGWKHKGFCGTDGVGDVRANVVEAMLLIVVDVVLFAAHTKEWRGRVIWVYKGMTEKLLFFISSSP